MDTDEQSEDILAQVLDWPGSGIGGICSIAHRASREVRRARPEMSERTALRHICASLSEVEELDPEVVRAALRRGIRNALNAKRRKRATE